MKRKEINSSRMPVYRDAGFELYDAKTTADAFKKESEHSREPDIYIYSRYRNPTVVSAEEEIMRLEGCAWALLTQSGMSALILHSQYFSMVKRSNRGYSLQKSMVEQFHLSSRFLKCEEDLIFTISLRIMGNMTLMNSKKYY